MSFENQHKRDHFCLLQAASRAETPASPQAWASAVAAYIFFSVFAFLPYLLLALLPIFAVFPSPHIPTCLAAVTIWLWFIVLCIQNFRLLSGTEYPHCIANLGKKTRIIVVGAGPVGLSVVKECLAQGLDVMAYEQKGTLGGVFYYTEESQGGVWKGCRLVSSPWVTAFSDFPPRKHTDKHMTNQQYHQYLVEYADRFHLWPCLQFRHTVLNIRRGEEDMWFVTIRNDSSGLEWVQRADYVAVCAGLAMKQRDVPLPGRDSFNGKIVEVSHYKRPDDFKGKRVLVMGNGESGVGVATEISEMAHQVFLSFRRGKFIIPRVDRYSKKANDYDTNRVRYASPAILRNWYMLFKRRAAYALGFHDKSSAVATQSLEASGLGPMSQVAIKTDAFIEPLLSGRLAVRTELRSLRQNVAVFDDCEEEVDAVVVACGYAPAFPFLQLPPHIPMQAPGSLYLKMFVPEIGKRLVFCGYARPTIGAIPPTGELQARYFALVASGQRELPSEEYMRDCVTNQLRRAKQIYGGLQNYGLLVSWIPYMDSLAEKIGCRPDPWKLAQDSKLLWKVMTGPVTGATYRIHGVGSKQVARDTVLHLEGTHPLRETFVHFGMHFWSWPISFLNSHAIWQQHNTFV